MKKKLLSLLLSATLVLGTMPAALAADDVPFSARSGETELEVVRSGEDYTYTETLYMGKRARLPYPVGHP